VVNQKERRRLLAGAGAGAALWLAGCGRVANHVKTTVPVSSADLDHLSALLDAEQKTVAAYQAGIPLLDQALVKPAIQFLKEELSHVGELAGLIKKAGGKPAHPPLYDLGHPRTSNDVLTLLHDLERAQLSAYLSAIPQLSSGKTRAALAAVFANDAQHVTVLRQQLGTTPVAQAFVIGRQ
jgi:bacterioferritin (cytochrome b1)